MEPAVDIDALLARMTLDEKLAQLGCVWWTALVDERRVLARNAARRWLAARHRRDHPHRRDDRAAAARARGVRQRDPALPRRARRGSASPRSCTRRAPPGSAHATRRSSRRRSGSPRRGTRTLVERIGGVIREQMVATGARHTLAPVLDVAPRPALGPRRGDLRRGRRTSRAASASRTCAACRGDLARRRRRDRQALPRLRAVGRRAEPRTGAPRAARAARGVRRAVPRRDRGGRASRR